MREIKFRAWDIENKEYIHNIEIYYDFPKFIVHEDLIIEQYIGLKDKKGYDIYEGDIVYFEADDENYVIEYRESTLSYDLRKVNKKTFECPLGYLIDISHCEVIGNIHEVDNA